MPKFGRKSKDNLYTCHRDIQTVCNELIKYIDFSVICGHRTKQEQDKAYAAGNTHAKWPKSAHNTFPSLAVDITPYPLDWNDIGAFKRLNGAFVVIAAKLLEEGKISSTFEWGGDWKSLKDYPHYQIKEK